MSKEAMKLALEALNTTESDCGSRAWEREQEAITALLEALTDPTTTENNGGKTGWPPGLLQDDCKGLSKWLSSRPDARRRVREALVEQPAKQDIPDLIAGTLGVSRGTAYDLMREALQEVQQEPVAFVLRHKNGLEFNSNYPMVKTLEEAEDLKRRHFGEVKIAALYTTPPAAPVQEPTLQKQLDDALSSLDFYKRRVDALQQWQSKMRDPERTIVCDIIANGCTLDPAGNRYTPPAAQRQWVGLTDEDIEQEFGFIDELLRDCVHRTEAKVMEKNL